ncbi:hypothetical protein [Actinomadura sp. NEAU-AAG7]|uniref:hypothetical protein n=1 Tax=Actinomadura sp. NEAU-AAG7 TaxID=2839640 RepID=UPI001BE4CE41|nr:hypothetical protein [Actinomadura sp. NEAU-AAG7]MBT2207233.1 hypothetical protein [Actinomadura sp. NEAU-AAG7]
MRPLSHLAHPDGDIAFDAFHAFISPALRAAARGPLLRARHAGRACGAPTGSRWCADCEATADDLLMASFKRLRSALDKVPATRAGRPVREMALLGDHLLSADAQGQDSSAWAPRLREAGNIAEPAWLRAARAQLVHYPLRHLEAQTRRADAVRRGAAARPDRDLRQAVWAAPLREDPAGLEMLIMVVFRIRRRVSDPFQVPDDLRERHGLTHAEASRRMGRALSALRTANPGFFAANIEEPVNIEPPTDPQDAFAADRLHARATLTRLLTTRADEPDPHATRRRTYRKVTTAVCAIGIGHQADPVAVATQDLGLAPEPAGRMVRRLALLVATAGVDWTDRVAEFADTSVR